MNHGAGGRAMVQLITELFARHLDNATLRQGNDGAVITTPQLAGASSRRLVMSTDAHVVSPLFFPGGDIGCLAVHGTLNDVAMMGATPIALSVAFILEEGLPLADLDRIVQSMAHACTQAGVPVVTGDTKVVERGKADGVFITSSAIGILPEHITLGGQEVRAGDAVLVSGCIGDHGVAVMSQRENLTFDAPIQSDTAALHGLVAHMLGSGLTLHCLRDPTRGGVAATLNEIATQACVGIVLRERDVPVKPAVAAACELLGLDPLNVANEGKLLAFCPQAQAEALLAVMQQHPLGKDARIMGEVVADAHRFVQLETAFGGRRIVDWLSGDPLPRIC
jgi:hydrogenase expression/formation protein HypE